MGKRLAKKVLLVGWDAADWKMINPLLDAGEMPALERIVNNGVIGNLATLDPPLSPMLWTSIATGKTADQHGVMGFSQPREDGKGLRPVLSTSRKVKAVWNILMQNGCKTNVVGWWPSHPAEKVDGVFVSNFFQRAHRPIDQPWPMAAGTVHPQELAEQIAKCRIHPQELTAQHLLPFVPKAAEIDQEKDKRLESLAKIIADCSTVHAAATWIMENTEWDFMAVYYDSIDHFGHGFMKFHPPRRPHIPKDLYELYKDVNTAGYKYHDMMLDRLLQLAPKDTTVIMISDHGFHSDHLRPVGIPKEPAGPAAEHNPYGTFAMMGPHVQKDERIYGATLLDVCPTLLTLFGLPIGKDMRGKPLVQSFESPVKPDYIDSWEDVEGDSGMHDEDARSDPWAEQEALNQMVALGYIEAPGEDQQENIDQTINESNYWLARVYLSSKRLDKALPILEELCEKFPDQRRYALKLANCYMELNHLPECRRVIEDILEKEETLRDQVRREHEEKRKELEEKQAKGEPIEEPEEENLSPEEQQKRRREWMKKPVPVSRASLNLLHGNLLMAEERYEEGLEYLGKAEQASPRLPNLHQQIGNAYLKLRRWDDAERAFDKALEIDGDSSVAYCGLARVYIHCRAYEDAADAALTAVGLRYYYPIAHYLLGESLIRLYKFDHAVKAFEVCVSQAPGMIRAHRRLVKLYRDRLQNPEKAEEHKRFIEEQIKSDGLTDGSRSEQQILSIVEAPPQIPAGQTDAKKIAAAPDSEIITVVSGLPRSGTSLMMQMLEAGGLEILTDGVREADENNLRGYYEYEKVKSLQRDKSWLSEAKGKVVKIVAPLLHYLPNIFHYRLLFVERNIEEILRSQTKMLAHLKQSGGNPRTLAAAYVTQVKRAKKGLAEQADTDVLYVPYREVIENPKDWAARIDRFLDRPLVLEKMAAVVEPALYRQRID